MKMIGPIDLIASLALVVLFTGSFSAVSLSQERGAMSAERLRCEYKVDPAGIDVAAPRLDWIVVSDERAQVQSAYRIIVASSMGMLGSGQGDVWDTGQVQSSETSFIEYAGAPLESNKQYFWKVRVWDAQARPSDWSAAATWSTGLLEQDDWRAEWIGRELPVSKKLELQKQATFQLGGEFAKKDYYPALFLRKEFTAGQQVKRAVVFATALGIYELYINGERVGDDYFTPGWSDYNKRIYYNAYDVTKMLNRGDNAIGAIVADGWYAGNVGSRGQRVYGSDLRLRAQLHIEYKDGSHIVIPTDATWKMNIGPIREADIHAGEFYDAGREIPAWANPGLDDSKWKPVTVRESFAVPVQAYPGIPVRKTAEVRPVEITQPRPGVYVYNLGQNFAGVARLKVTGDKGTKVTLRFAEMLNPDGTIYTTNLRGARATDYYVLRGGGEEIWEPRFTFHGFQYVEVTGYPGVPGPDAITGIVMNTDLPFTSTFESSSPMVNKLYSNIVWGQRSNYLEVPTDCPQRDERLGWMGDAQAFVRTAAYNMDIGAFFTKWMVDVEDGQHQDGGFPDTAPEITEGVASGWADAGIICPWSIYRAYGDKRILEKHYGAMEKFMEFLQARSTGHLAQPVGTYADWLNVDAPTANDLITNAYFAYDARLMSQIADALGKKEDAKKYRELFGNVSEAFNKKYVLADGTVGEDTQTAYLLALDFGILPENLKSMAREKLVENIEQHDWSLTTGFLGAQLLLPTLTDSGRTDVAYRLIENRKYPSWGYSIDQGATTIWERWNSYTVKDGFNNPGMNSFNHYTFGAVGRWMFETMAGIDTNGPGFGNITIRPRPGGAITWIRASYDSIRGKISTHWRYEGDDFLLDVTIPANTTARVYIPATAAGNVTEGGGATGASHGVTPMGMDAETSSAIFEIGSGKYSFRSKNARSIVVQ